MKEIETPHGLARAHLHEAVAARGLLVLGHGAGGGVGAPDLVRVTKATVEAGVSVALVEQPYRVAGRRSPAPAKQLDAAWIAVCDALRTDLPLVTGGRSSGARVACRTAGDVGAAGVLCLAFPLQAKQSRLPELEAVEVPVLIVQGENDRFGMPPEGPRREVVTVRGDHGLKKDLDVVAQSAVDWLSRLLRVG